MDSRIIAPDLCPCLRCKVRPERGRVLCWWHDALLPTQAKRRYVGLLDLYTGPADKGNLVRVAADLAMICATIARKEGYISPQAFARVQRRYAGLSVPTRGKLSGSV